MPLRQRIFGAPMPADPRFDNLAGVPVIGRIAIARETPGGTTEKFRAISGSRSSGISP